MTSFDPNPPSSIETYSADPAPHVVAEDELDRLLAHDAEQRRREREETRNWMYGFSVAGVLLGVIALVASLFAVTRSTGTTTRTVVATAPAAAGPAAGGAAASSPAAAAPGHEVTASLTEMKIADSVSTVAAGKVTFKVTNHGSVAHEYVILKTSHPAAGLPMAGGKASEAGHVGEIGDLPAGATKSVTLNLKPGHYSIICNLPGHYMGGMHADLTVVAAGAGAASAGASAPATAPSASPAAPGHDVTARLTEMKITDSVAKVAAGKVTFKVTNAGSVAHEYVILKTAKLAADLPTAGGKASEAGHVGEIGDLPVGATKSVTLNLKPGHYSIICNLPGHYMGGMHTDLTVT